MYVSDEKIMILMNVHNDATLFFWSACITGVIFAHLRPNLKANSKTLTLRIAKLSIRSNLVLSVLTSCWQMTLQRDNMDGYRQRLITSDSGIESTPGGNISASLMCLQRGKDKNHTIFYKWLFQYQGPLAGKEFTFFHANMQWVIVHKSQNLDSQVKFLNWSPGYTRSKKIKIEDLFSIFHSYSVNVV